MVIGVCGYGYTGSGAVYDYLKDRLECQCIDEEFNIAYMPHGISDLDYHLNEKISRYYSSDAAIKDFLRYVEWVNSSPNSFYMRRMGKKFIELSEEYIAKITQLKWHGWWSYDVVRSDFIKQTIRFRLLRRYYKLYESLTKKTHKLPKDEIMYFSVKPECFLEASKDYINKLLTELGCSQDKIIVLNQPFEANSPQNSMKYFNNAKAIIVDKDPRDVYILAKQVIRNNAAFIPTKHVDDFIKYYKLCRKFKPALRDDILAIAFEDMVYSYDKTISRINRFVGIPDLSSYKQNNFNPAQSINNTQLWKRYPQYSEDVIKIEKCLPEYLFNFSSYSMSPNDGLPFDK